MRGRRKATKTRIFDGRIERIDSVFEENRIFG